MDVLLRAIKELLDSAKRIETPNIAGVRFAERSSVNTAALAWVKTCADRLAKEKTDERSE